jgi:hypothetical protein
MPQRPKGPLILSILITTVGVGWLLTARGYAPGVNWIWTLGLGVLGVSTFMVSGGLNKVSVVIGPLLLVASILSILRQTGRLSFEVEVPILVILLGFLLFLAQRRQVPAPPWLTPQPPRADG